MRILGLDVGTKTIGVAVSDEMGWTGQGMALYGGQIFGLTLQSWINTCSNMQLKKL
jgi:RNase H-fold protein (predicted Holliday junction resolvase)